ncbi:hypothetical protein COT51_01355 [candidate division WWE3 bacterium CG08_land_8_20_14_0_20_41_15]|uniref:PD-(D/E)XK endonuclease-like domain-containing protein n=1 Tax=candidate division WWE3 bacterium CG08_land_8_20_14_0_20_41_15 TaxID=1975086 RepID=A0A2H0XC68_UNCKA|nr:MAG: hypothetical protein COT51_01355 [candidate division WWE3 bacterium CG08_land_8_20_14_0_20_41_15]
MAFNPNAIWLSPSSLSDFTKCPQLYYYRSIFRTERGLKLQIINPSLALGQSVHETLNFFVKLPPADRTKDKLFSQFQFYWGMVRGEKGGFNSPEEEKEFEDRAISMLERFFLNKHFIEAEMPKIPDFPKVDLGNDLILTGKLDWLEKEGDGYHLIDFKTGKNEERDDSLQLPIYAALVNGLFKTDKIRASYWYLDKEGDLVDFKLPELASTIEHLKRMGEIIKMVKKTNSFHCQSGNESCWACKDMLAVAEGEGKLVNMDPVNRKQEIYILQKKENTLPQPPEIESTPESLPF